MNDKLTPVEKEGLVALEKMMFQDFEKNLETSVENVDQVGLKSIAELARQIRDIEELIDDQETRLKAQKRELQKLTDEDLPSMMAEIIPPA